MVHSELRFFRFPAVLLAAGMPRWMVVRPLELVVERLALLSLAAACVAVLSWQGARRVLGLSRGELVPLVVVSRGPTFLVMLGIVVRRKVLGVLHRAAEEVVVVAVEPLGVAQLVGLRRVVLYRFAVLAWVLAEVLQLQLVLRLQSLGDVLLLVGLTEVGDLLLEVHDLAHVYALVHQVLAPHLFSLQVNRVDVVAVSRRRVVPRVAPLIPGLLDH